MSNIKKSSEKILITGGAGYIGLVVAERLINKGFNLKVVDTFYFGEDKINFLKKNIEIIKCDIRKIPNNLLDGITSIIHLAALSNDSTAEFNPKLNLEINTKATIKLAKLAKKSGVKKFIFGSSSSIYDFGLHNEDSIKDENAIVKPTLPYSVSKYEAEKEILKLADKNFCITILRKGTVCGFSPRMRFDLVVNIMLKNALATNKINVFCKGIQWRPIIDVRDVAEAYYRTLIADNKLINGHIFNISHDNFLVKDIANKVKNALGKHFRINTEIEFKEDNRKDRSYRICNKKAQKILNFKPYITIEESVINMVKEMKKNKMNDFDNPNYYNIEWMKPILSKLINTRNRFR